MVTGSEILLYQTEDGLTRIDIRLEGETLWLTQNQMAELFQTSKQNISLHLKNVFSEGELAQASVVKEYLTTAGDGKKYSTNFYNLDAVLAVGYRVKSYRGTQFRIWATQTLREYLIKGFALDDERLKRAGGDVYFEELLARIRDIRSSEKVFWKKVLEIYATSIDYDSRAEASQLFFKTVQNKMHWAAHGHTAAEIISVRADSTKPHMGMTAWTGNRPKRTDAGIAKNYLNHEELELLNHIVTAYLEFAELQAKSRKPMYMKDWISKLDDFLKLSDREILTHAGSISHAAVISKATEEYDRYQAKQEEQPSRVERDFQIALEQVKQLESVHRKKKNRSKPE